MKKIAEILVECGYASQHTDWQDSRLLHVREGMEYVNTSEGWKTVCPFADTLEGRRQADALEDWLHYAEPTLLMCAKQHCKEPVPYNGRQKRLARIKWCFEQLEVLDD